MADRSDQKSPVIADGGRPDDPADVGNEAGTLPTDLRIPLHEVFHRVNNAVPDAQQVVSVSPDLTAAEALELMKEHHFSQLPVVRGREILGIFSHRSFALGAVNHSSQIPLARQPVEEFLEDAVVVHATAELSSIYPALDENDVILVGLPNELQGVVTANDVIQYLSTLSEPFVHLGEIERSLRGVVKHCVERDAFDEGVQRALASAYVGRESDLPTDVADMTLGEIVSLIRDGRNYQQYASLLGAHRENFAARFGGLSELRNILLHFRRELTQDEREQIAEARNWLLRKLRGSGAVR